MEVALVNKNVIEKREGEGGPVAELTATPPNSTSALHHHTREQQHHVLNTTQLRPVCTRPTPLVT